jgi:hypothetical protein
LGRREAAWRRGRTNIVAMGEAEDEGGRVGDRGIICARRSDRMSIRALPWQPLENGTSSSGKVDAA